MPIGDYNNDVNQQLARIERLLEQVLFWTKIGNLGPIRELLLKELNSNKRIIIYESLDGETSLQNVAKISEVSVGALSQLIHRWRGLGIITESSRGYMKKVVSLQEVGITSPRINERDKQVQETSIEPNDLGVVLNNYGVFPDNQALAEFAYNILPGTMAMAKMLTRQELITDIIITFKTSRSLQRALFIQALERRVFSTGNTQFRKYFDIWEKHISE